MDKNIRKATKKEDNARGIAFYKRNGFELTGEKFLEEGWIPLLKMQCE